MVKPIKEDRNMANIGVPVTRLTNSWTIIRTMGGSFTVSMVHFTNVSMVIVKVRLCLVPPAGLPSIGNALCWDLPLPANDVLELLAGDMWPPGYTLQAMANMNNVANIKVAGTESV